jgi:hypothetical protein
MSPLVNTPGENVAATVMLFPETTAAPVGIATYALPPPLKYRLPIPHADLLFQETPAASVPGQIPRRS